MSALLDKAQQNGVAAGRGGGYDADQSENVSGRSYNDNSDNTDDDLSAAGASVLSGTTGTGGVRTADGSESEVKKMAQRETRTVRMWRGVVVRLYGHSGCRHSFAMAAIG